MLKQGQKKSQGFYFLLLLPTISAKARIFFHCTLEQNHVESKLDTGGNQILVSSSQRLKDYLLGSSIQLFLSDDVLTPGSCQLRPLKLLVVLFLGFFGIVKTGILGEKLMFGWGDFFSLDFLFFFFFGQKHTSQLYPDYYSVLTSTPHFLFC